MSLRTALLPAVLPLGLGALGVAGAAALVACTEPSEPRESARSSARSPAKAEAPASAHDAGATVAVTAFDASVAPPPYDGPLIGALFLQTPIMSDMEWPAKDDDPPSKRRERAERGSMRIGYLRQGAKVPVIDQPHEKSNCKDGWYELVQGGFVCGRYASLDLNHPKIKLAPHPPNLDGPLPYEYGYNVANGTPLYRTLPSREERLRLEPWLAGGRKPKPKPKTEEVVVQTEDLDAGAGTGLVLARATLPSDPVDSDPLDAGVPWYLRDHDGGKPLITLDELRGEGPMARRMVKGFFVALDKEETEKNIKWWRTTGNLMAPYDRIYVHKTASEFQGIWLDERGAPPASATEDGGAIRKPIADLCKPGSKAQVAIVLFYKAKKYEMTSSRKAVVAGEVLPRHSVVRLTGDSVNINGARYDETDEGFWVRRADTTRTDPGPVPRDLAPGEKWIDVNLKTQTLVAFEGDKAVYATAVSTGKEDKEDKARDHKTPEGTFRIREKHVAATMDGDGASDGPYSIEDVPWIMYYSGSYALHGAFWHNQFGREKSHGCTNLAPRDARAMFGWTEPKLPEGWHAVWATPERPGTRVVVHE